mgnify:CR=1 FL=1
MAAFALSAKGRAEASGTRLRRREARIRRCAGAGETPLRCLRMTWPPGAPPTFAVVPAPLAVSSKPREFFIHGITAAGRPFRPSDWAERLCGVMSGYRPGGMATGRDAHIGYSPYVRPMLVGGVKCVVVDERLRGLEPMAFDFVMNFARDNDLPVYEGCTMPGSGG